MPITGHAAIVESSVTMSDHRLMKFVCIWDLKNQIAKTGHTILKFYSNLSIYQHVFEIERPVTCTYLISNFNRNLWMTGTMTDKMFQSSELTGL